MPQTRDVIQGTLDLLVLASLRAGPMHGWGVSQRIQQGSSELLVVNQGSLYPALHRLEEQGFIQAEWRTSEHNRRAKYYQLTRAGRKALGDELSAWLRFVDGVAGVVALGLGNGRTA